VADHFAALEQDASLIVLLGRPDLEDTAVHDKQGIPRLSGTIKNLALRHVPNPGQFTYGSEFRTLERRAKCKEVSIHQ
jgi:hypothetical protein